MNAQTIDLVTLRMAIRTARRNMKVLRNDITQINKYDRLATLLTKYQAIHIQKTGEIYT